VKQQRDTGHLRGSAREEATAPQFTVTELVLLRIAQMAVGADPMQDAEDVNRLLSAAIAGDCGKLGELLRANPSLLTRTCAEGCSVLHCAVARHRLVAVKYLLGWWDAGSQLLSTVDAGGNTPLHLFCGPPPLLLLLLHAGAPPPLDVCNSRGLTPQQVAAKALNLDATETAALFQRFRVGLDLSKDERILLAFLPSSPLRRQPRESRFWWFRINRADFTTACCAVISVGCFCLRPAAGAAVSLTVLALEFGLFRLRKKLSSQSVALLLCIAVAVLVSLTLTFSLVPQLTRTHRMYLTGLIGSYAHLIFIGPSRTVGGPIEAQQYWAALEEYSRPGASPNIESHLGASPTIESRDEAHPNIESRTGASPNIASRQVGRPSIAATAMPPLEERTRLGATSMSASSEAVRTPRERQPCQEASSSIAATAMPPGFCPRSEAIRTPRSKYSPLSQGLVPVMDHDCAFVGCAIGEGNHRAFVLFLLSAVAYLLVFLRFAAAAAAWARLLKQRYSPHALAFPPTPTVPFLALSLVMSINQHKHNSLLF
jgi:hypothetical protein